MTDDLPAYKITLANGSSYVTSMSKGTTLEAARAYFLGQELVQDDETTMLRIVAVDPA
jgi:hypothetical protein